LRRRCRAALLCKSCRGAAGCRPEQGVIGAAAVRRVARRREAPACAACGGRLQLLDLPLLPGCVQIKDAECCQYSSRSVKRAVAKPDQMSHVAYRHACHCVSVMCIAESLTCLQPLAGRGADAVCQMLYILQQRPLGLAGPGLLAQELGALVRFQLWVFLVLICQDSHKVLRTQRRRFLQGVYSDNARALAHVSSSVRGGAAVQGWIDEFIHHAVGCSKHRAAVRTSCEMMTWYSLPSMHPAGPRRPQGDPQAVALQ